MDLSPEQQMLITHRARADSPSPAAAYSLWLLFGFFGGHRFYLRCKASGAIIAAATISAMLLLGLGLIYGGTPIDGLFYRPSVSDILRSSQSALGKGLFYAGASLCLAVLAGWALDAVFISRIIQSRRAANRQKLTRFFADY